MNHALLSDVLLALAALAYACATLGFAIHLARRGGASQVSFYARRLLAIGVVLHAVHIGYYAFANRICPMTTVNLGVSMGALAAGFVYLVARKGLKIYGLGIFVAPIACVFLFAGRFLAVQALPPYLRGGLLPVHITANVVGDAFFLLAAGAAAMYLVQEHQLKAKRGASVFGRLPPLDTLDRAAHIFLVGGFVLLTLGAVTGTAWVSKLSVGTSPEFLRVIFGYLTWLLFSAVLLLRTTLRWRGKRAAYGTLAAFACAVVVVLLYLYSAVNGDT